MFAVLNKSVSILWAVLKIYLLASIQQYEIQCTNSKETVILALASLNIMSFFFGNHHWHHLNVNSCCSASSEIIILYSYYPKMKQSHYWHHRNLAITLACYLEFTSCRNVQKLHSLTKCKLWLICLPWNILILSVAWFMWILLPKGTHRFYCSWQTPRI